VHLDVGNRQEIHFALRGYTKSMYDIHCTGVGAQSRTEALCLAGEGRQPTYGCVFAVRGETTGRGGVAGTEVLCGLSSRQLGYIR
jgi:hypothetical protein